METVKKMRNAENKASFMTNVHVTDMPGYRDADASKKLETQTMNVLRHVSNLYWVLFEPEQPLQDAQKS